MYRSLLNSVFIFCFAVALPAEEYRDVISAQNVLKLYSKTYGAFGEKDKLNSIIINGRQIQNGLTCQITIHKKRPDLMRYRLKAEGVTLTTTYDGKKAWLTTKAFAQTSHRVLSASELIEVQREALFDGPLFRSMEKTQTKVSYARRDQLGDTELIVLRVEERGSTDSLYYLDPATSYLLRMDRLNENGEVIFQTLYRDYKLVDGYPFAHEIENRVAGERVSLTQVDSIIVNPGILSLVFSDPSKGID